MGIDGAALNDATFPQLSPQKIMILHNLSWKNTIARTKHSNCLFLYCFKILHLFNICILEIFIIYFLFHLLFESLQNMWISVNKIDESHEKP